MMKETESTSESGCPQKESESFWVLRVLEMYLQAHGVS
jgi:hypothetical protein